MEKRRISEKQKNLIEKIEKSCKIRFEGEETMEDAYAFIKDHMELYRTKAMNDPEGEPTKFQLKKIKDIENLLKLDKRSVFKGKTKKAAGNYIKKHIGAFELKMAHIVNA